MKSRELDSKAETKSTLSRQPTAEHQQIAEHPLLRLQRKYGNRYVQRVLALSKKADGGTEVAPEVEQAIRRARGGGQALDSSVRTQMESAFGADFSGVRVHADAQADALNQSLNARAFTTGQDIFFQQGAYSPGSSSGRELLAHELTHVVQQAGGARSKLAVGQPGDVYEQEADQVARAVMQRERQVAQRQTDGRLIRRQAEMEEGEEEESIQARVEDAHVQRQVEPGNEEEEEEPVQAKAEDVRVQQQFEEEEKEEPIQTKMDGSKVQWQMEEKSAANNIADEHHLTGEMRRSTPGLILPEKSDSVEGSVTASPGTAMVHRYRAATKDEYIAEWWPYVRFPISLDIENWEMDGHKGSWGYLPSIVAEAFELAKGKIELSVDTSSPVTDLGYLQPVVTGANTSYKPRVKEDRMGNTELTIPAEAFKRTGWNNIKAVFTHDGLKRPIADLVRIYSHSKIVRVEGKPRVVDWLNTLEPQKNQAAPGAPNLKLTITSKHAVRVGTSKQISQLEQTRTSVGAGLTGQLGKEDVWSVGGELSVSHEVTKSINTTLGMTSEELQEKTQEYGVEIEPGKMAIPLYRDIYYQATVLEHEQGIYTGKAHTIVIVRTRPIGYRTIDLPPSERVKAT